MSWLEISFEIHKSQAEFYSEKLEELGAVSVSFFDAGEVPVLEPLPGTTPLWDKVKVVGLFPETIDIKSIEASIKSLLPQTIINITPLAEQDWTRVWLEHFHPIKFGQKLWVIPSDSPAPEDKNAVVVKLDPGLAFGTGTHSTTALCLQWLDAHPPINQTVIDYGCGSGILGIAALKLGAKKVWAIDYDPQAIAATQENRLRNDVAIESICALTPQELPIDLQAQTVLANILAEPLIQLAPVLQACCAVGGNLVMSGLLTKQIEAVRAAYEPWFSFEEVKTHEDWVLLWGVKV